MKANNWWLVCLVVLLNLACKSLPESPDLDQPPNIVFIFTDDHSYQTFSAYDDRYLQTPNLDRIANEGALFSNSFVTNSICAPSRAVILTGKHSHLNGQLDNVIRFDSSQVTFPKLLQHAGYQTAIVGKWHLKSRPTGYDHFEVLIGQGNYYNSDFIENGEKVRSEGYVTDVITDKSIDWLEKRNKEKPFCLQVQHKATHRIWMPDTTLFEEFAGREFPIPETFFDDYSGRLAAAQQEMSIAKDMDLVWDNKMLDPEAEIETRLRNAYANRMYGRMNPAQKASWDAHYQPVIDQFKKAGLTGQELAIWKYQRYMQDYLACVRSLDNNIGRLMQYLEETGLAENTLVVYTSDQGFYMGEHGWFDKRFMYEESLRTPLVMRYPGKIDSGTRIDAMVQNLDHAPTILDFAGAAIPEDMQGLSMKPLLENKETPWRTSVYYHYYEYPGAHSVKKHYGIRTDRYKLIHFYDDIDTWELYDLEQDPDEMKNLFEQEGYEAITADLKTELDSLQTAYRVNKY
jgi:arylsulfatase A-like enzyme